MSRRKTVDAKWMDENMWVWTAKIFKECFGKRKVPLRDVIEHFHNEDGWEVSGILLRKILPKPFCTAHMRRDRAMSWHSYSRERDYRRACRTADLKAVDAYLNGAR